MDKPKLGKKLPAVQLGAPMDPTRVMISEVAPPDDSIYSNTVTSNDSSLRTPSTPQVGGLPNMQFKKKTNGTS